MCREHYESNLGAEYSSIALNFRIARQRRKRQFVTSGGGYEFAATSI